MDGLIMKQVGFTLFELLIVLLIISITLVIGIPSFSEQINKSKTKVAMHDLLSAIESTRSLAVYSNNRAVLLAHEKDWTQGWSVFLDKNNDGVLNENETLKFEQAPLPHIKIHANTHVHDYISFISTGEGRKVGSGDGGAFQVGTIKICPIAKGTGYSLILSRGGRTRVKSLTAKECSAI